MRLKDVAVCLIAVGCLTTVVEGQKSFWDSPQAYLGQTHPSDTPQIFAPGLLTDPGTIAIPADCAVRPSLSGYSQWLRLSQSEKRKARYSLWHTGQ